GHAPQRNGGPARASDAAGDERPAVGAEAQDVVVGQALAALGEQPLRGLEEQPPGTTLALREEEPGAGRHALVAPQRHRREAALPLRQLDPEVAPRPPREISLAARPRLPAQLLPGATAVRREAQRAVGADMCRL